MRDFINSVRKNKAVMAVLSILLGLFLLIRQGSAIADLLKVLGILILIAAVINLITWLAAPAPERSSGLLCGIVVMVIVGLVFVFAPGWLITLFPVLMGLAMIISSIANIAGIMGTGARAGLFGPGLVMSIISLILGIVVLFHPGATANIIIALVGVNFLANGISDLLVLFTLGH